MEDILTAQVLGAARYLPSAACWAPLVAIARQPDGQPIDVHPPPPWVDSRFWPRWPHGDGRFTEPDVVLRWPDALVVVEVKYRSGKSSQADDEAEDVTDQLARQLVLARDIAKAEGRTSWAVIYLTADPTCPRHALRASLDEVEAKTGETLNAHLAWLSWHTLTAGITAWTAHDPGAQQLQADLVVYLDGLGFGRFAGVTACPRPFPQWRLRSSINWTQPVPPPPWTFKGHK